jgi:hypothetical protein
MRIVYASYLRPALAPGGDQEVAYALCEVSARHVAAPEENQRRAYSKSAPTPSESASRRATTARA